ncbi:LamG-like jellyroll fold domain-containing protein [Cellulomonas sp. PhB143]|uniref:LamG-like jellyroll fold domain-containing protein n=1 Tax=Cellulomonas sp. PhB143 TaxID=2485186 RepID=UPI000F46F704|nr:LamG-like jellyroll fold domain-containing protein [Cellulomonas sp. PhB143]ROS78682.1 concanavalin A-like lectin/glucanase superfamily protein [Cellulomonas sp. PhB143]
MRSLVAVVCGAALAFAGLFIPASAPSAAALSDGLGFTADDLPTWQTNGTVWALAASGNVVFAGGTFSQVRPPDGAGGSPVAATSLVVLDASTGSPTSCRPALELSGGTPTVRALDVSPDGKTLYVGGAFSKIGGVSKSRLAAIDIASCTVKTGFSPVGVSSTVRALDSTADTVYLGGDFLRVDGKDRQHFASVNATTGALKPWVADTDLQGKAVAVGNDGATVAIGGNFFTVNGADSHSFGIVDATTGANVRDFPRGFVPDTSTTQGITTDSTGYYAGNEGTGGGVFDGSFAINYSSFDERWRDLCLGATQALVVDRGTLYEANHHHDCSLEGEFADGLRMYLTANDTQSDKMLAWRPTLNDGVSIGPRALTVGEKGSTRYLWVGGEFTLTNRNAQQGLTRFASGPDVGAPDTPSPKAQSLRTGEIQVSWRTSFDDDDGKLTYNVYRDGSSTPIATVSAESRWWTRPQASFVDTTASPGRTYSYRVSASDGTNTSALSSAATVKAATTDASYAASVLGDGASLYWRYDDAAGRYGTDSSPSNHEPNYMKAVTYRAGSNSALNDPGSSMAFDGATAYAYSDALAPAPSTYTVETWFKTTSTRGGKIIGYGNGVPNTLGTAGTQLSGNYDRHVYMTDDGKLVFGAYTGSTVTVSSGKSYNDGQWHAVVASQGASGMTLYVDGVRVGRNSNASAQTYSGSWRVGGDNISGWPSQPSSNFFAGEIDETAVYPTVLPAATVRSHFDASGRSVDVPSAPTDSYGAAVYSADPDFFWRLDDSSPATAKDSSAYANTGTYGGLVTTGHGGALESGTAATFAPASSSDGGTIASDVQVSNPKDYSLEMWFESTSGSGGKLIGFGDNKNGLSSNYDRHVFLRDDGRLVFGTWTGAANIATSPASYTDGRWHHMVATQSSTAGMSLYVDGDLVASNPQTTAQDYSGYWKVGGDPTWDSSSPYFSGDIDEVAVYGKVLTANQVAQHYALGTGATPPDVVKPSAPASVGAEAVGDDGVDLAWTASTDDVGIARYDVHRAKDADFQVSASTKVGDTAATKFSDTGVAPGTWYYRLVAVDEAGNQSAASATAEVKVVGPDTSAPTAPSDVTTKVDGTSVTVGWSASTDDRAIARYTVYRSSDEGFVPSAATKVGGTTSERSWNETGVPVGTWFYKVTGEDRAGNVSMSSTAVRAEIVGPDTVAPSAPSGLSAAATGSSVAVSWAAATDDRGVVSYDVFRSGEADFAPSSSTKVGNVTGTSFTESGLSAGRYYYKVVALDAAGNRSSATAAATVSVAAPPVDTVKVELAPSDDAYVHQSAAGTNYGLVNQLSVLGGSPVKLSYFKFSLPTAPSGTELVGASLRLTTTTSASAGSTDDFPIGLAAGDWAEASVTYTNRPTMSTDVIGTLSAPDADATSSVRLQSSALAPRLGTTTTLGMRSTGVDSIYLWSKEFRTAAQRPLLVLEFGAVAP